MPAVSRRVPTTIHCSQLRRSRGRGRLLDRDGTLEAGYQRRKSSVRVSSKTRVRTWSSRCAPRGDQRICCFLTMRLLTTWLMVASANAVEIASPQR
jgi:hypothetical protein